jgi:hypothetical protein
MAKKRRKVVKKRAKRTSKKRATRRTTKRTTKRRTKKRTTKKRSTKRRMTAAQKKAFAARMKVARAYRSSISSNVHSEAMLASAINYKPASGRVGPFAGVKPKKKASKSRGKVVTAASIIAGARKSGARVWICAGKVPRGCGGRARVVGRLR